jgi:hypothetical protein
MIGVACFHINTKLNLRKVDMKQLHKFNNLDDKAIGDESFALYSFWFSKDE